MRDSNQLTAIKVSKLKKPGRYGDGRGLYLQVSRWGTKAWLFRYMLNGKSREMGLGAEHAVGLAQARQKAQEARFLLAEGTDPIEHREKLAMAAKAEAAKQITFKDAAERYITAHKAGWKSAKHGNQWEATLKTYAYKVIGNLSVGAVETAHVVEIIEPI